MVAAKLYRTGFWRGHDKQMTLRQDLAPMTSEEAYTFRSKMSDPDNHFVYRVHKPLANRVVCCEGLWPEDGYRSFPVTTVRPGETDRAALARAGEAYGSENTYFIITEE